MFGAWVSTAAKGLYDVIARKVQGLAVAIGVRVWWK
jgi:hypothetical protein